MQAREAVTIRFPTAVISSARNAKGAHESLNDLVIEAVEREIRRRATVQAMTAIAKVRDAVKAQTGIHPDSGPLIRALRDGDRRIG